MRRGAVIIRTGRLPLIDYHNRACISLLLYYFLGVRLHLGSTWIRSHRLRPGHHDGHCNASHQSGELAAIEVSVTTYGTIVRDGAVIVYRLGF